MKFGEFNVGEADLSGQVEFQPGLHVVELASVEYKSNPDNGKEGIMLEFRGKNKDKVDCVHVHYMKLDGKGESGVEFMVKTLSHTFIDGIGATAEQVQNVLNAVPELEGGVSNFKGLAEGFEALRLTFKGKDKAPLLKIKLRQTIYADKASTRYDYIKPPCADRVDGKRLVFNVDVDVEKIGSGKHSNPAGDSDGLFANTI